MREKKKNLRNEMKARLAKLKPEELKAKSEALERRFIESPEFEAADSMLIYVAMSSEPETRKIIAEALKRKKAVFAPKVEGDFICVCRLHSLEHLSPGKFGIHEPPGEAKCELKQFGVIVIPGLAFDLRGGRLGRGGGFYDRLLSSVSGDFIGFCFDEQVVDEVPKMEHDVHVHKIFTDERVIECRKK
jgi:5-formyltetrahydrofolate cyclo-ligase